MTDLVKRYGMNIAVQTHKYMKGDLQDPPKEVIEALREYGVVCLH